MTCGETSNLSVVSALQVNVILLKKFIKVTKKHRLPQEIIENLLHI